MLTNNERCPNCPGAIDAERLAKEQELNFCIATILANVINNIGLKVTDFMPAETEYTDVERMVKSVELLGSVTTKLMTPGFMGKFESLNQYIERAAVLLPELRGKSLVDYFEQLTNANANVELLQKQTLINRLRKKINHG